MEDEFDEHPSRQIKRLIGTLVELTGEPEDRVVLRALEQRVARLTGPMSKAERSRGEMLAEISVQNLLHRLKLSVVPFTQEHWQGAVREYERHAKPGESDRPKFGQCLSAAVALKLGAPILE